MGNESILALGLVVVGLSPAVVYAQATPSPGGTVNVLVQEIRLLRQALEKQSATAARAQLLIGRLTLQDQRTARARQLRDLERELQGGG
jgi:hypothetical protein